MNKFRWSVVLMSFGLAAAVASASMTPFGFQFDGRDYTATAKVKMISIGGAAGGPFEVEILDTTSLFPLQQIQGLYQKSNGNWAFQTFCMEEKINMSYTTYYASIDSFAVRGTTEQNYGDRRAISKGASWIYDQWLDGTLPKYNSRDYTNAEINDALWALQEQSATGSTAAATLKDLALANAQSAPGGLALNLWKWSSLTLNNGVATTSPTDVQSHIVLIPAPAAAVLGMMGLGLVGWVKRRMA